MMLEKGFNLFNECSAQYVDMSLRKSSVGLLPKGAIKCTLMIPEQIHRGSQLK